MMTTMLKPPKKKYRTNWLDGVRKKRNIKVLYKVIGKQKPIRKNAKPKI